jgi:hypothetical protein
LLHLTQMPLDPAQILQAQKLSLVARVLQLAHGLILMLRQVRPLERIPEKERTEDHPRNSAFLSAVICGSQRRREQKITPGIVLSSVLLFAVGTRGDCNLAPG